MESFPLVPRAFSGRARIASASDTFEWLRQGWALFVAAPGPWLAATLLLIVFYMALVIVPLLGQLAANLLTPVLAAGMLQACARLTETGKLELSEFVAGFRHNSGTLMTVGLLYLAGGLLILLLVMLVFGSGMIGGALVSSAGHPAGGMGMGLGGLLFALLIGLLLGTPLLMALCFAPALVYFHDLGALPAMKASFAACLANWLALSILGLAGLILAFFAALPLGLGFLVLIPVLSGALYAAYRDLFIA